MLSKKMQEKDLFASLKREKMMACEKAILEHRKHCVGT
jgi:hypothetical protein